MMRTEASDKGKTPGTSTILVALVKDRTIRWPAHGCSFSKHSNSTAMHTSPTPLSVLSTSMAPTQASNQIGKSHHALPQPPSNHHPRLHTTAVGEKATIDGTNRNRKRTDITQLAAAEWTTPPRLIRYNQLIDAIKKQEHSQHNIFEVTTPHEYDTLCTYWTTYNYQQAFTLICTGEALKTTGNTHTSAKIKRQHAKTFKVENISLEALGDKAQCPWPFTPTQFKAADIPKVERTTIRIAAPQEYRQQYYEKDSAQKKLTDIATWYIDGFTTTTLSGGRWTKQWAGHKGQFELLVGFVKLDQKLVPQLLKHSGAHGIFFNVVEEAATRKPMQWFPRDKDTSTNHYLQNCLHEAKRQNQALHFRKGGANNLGIPCDPGQQSKPTHVIARGVPDSWEFEELQHLLTTQGWLDTKVINKYKKSHTNTEWHILGNPTGRPTAHLCTFLAGQRHLSPPRSGTR